MVTWIPSIYPLYVSIYTSTMYPMGYLKWLLSWFSWIYLIFVPVQFKLKPVKPLSSLVPYTHIYMYTTYFQIHLQIVAGDAAPNRCFSGLEPLPGFFLSTGLWLGNSGHTIATATKKWWNRVAYIWPDGTRWNQMDVQFERQDFSICEKNVFVILRKHQLLPVTQHDSTKVFIEFPLTSIP